MAVKLEAHPDFDLTLAQYVLNVRGWQADVKKVSADYLHEIPSEADINCMDERPEVNGAIHLGPKLPGGAYLLLGEVTGAYPDGIDRARKLAEQDGLKLGVHGGTHYQELDCGVGKLWHLDKMRFRFPIGSSLQEIARIIQAQGIYRVFEGPHEANQVEFNPYMGVTALKDGTRLQVDLGYGLKFLPQERLISLTAHAVEELGLPRRATFLQIV